MEIGQNKENRFSPQIQRECATDLSANKLKSSMKRIISRMIQFTKNDTRSINLNRIRTKEEIKEIFDNNLEDVAGPNVCTRTIFILLGNR